MIKGLNLIFQRISILQAGLLKVTFTDNVEKETEGPKIKT